ncbi:glycosyltransferase family 2 protein [Streptomyces sp. 549]|uniref:glycosyltransferase family 2 protein n=1 Tax=Streptomyces sp. 549 TaxID=3049076 RepID=UPI0024C30AFA|nr:glycosyltransferase family 2 protein [Streptomyces sp. 549]MDK1472719.1 glycosyltransferase family 2 protein [Streptomyces sp. 549]
MVKLSVIVPFYDVRPYAPDALRSLRANARPGYEFLLVDDCSTDGTAELLERAAEEIPGARLLRHEQNAGISAARNTGLSAARGEYVTFLDGDDWLAPGHYPELVSAIEELGCDFLRTDHVRATGTKRTVRRVPHGRRGVVLDPRAAILPTGRTTCVDYSYAWAGVYHRRLLEQGLLHFHPGLRTAEERPWIWRLHREAASFAVVGLLGVFYRRGVTSSLTQIGDARQLDFVRAFDLLVEETSRDPEAAALLPKAVRTYCAVIHHHLVNDRYDAAMARRVRTAGAAALRRLPAALVTEALDTMDAHRSVRLRRLRHRPSLAARPSPPAAGVAGRPPADATAAGPRTANAAEADR